MPKGRIQLPKPSDSDDEWGGWTRADIPVPKGRIQFPKPSDSDDEWGSWTRADVPVPKAEVGAAKQELPAPPGVETPAWHGGEGWRRPPGMPAFMPVDGSGVGDSGVGDGGGEPKDEKEMKEDAEVQVKDGAEVQTQRSQAQELRTTAGAPPPGQK